MKLLLKNAIIVSLFFLFLSPIRLMAQDMETLKNSGVDIEKSGPVMPSMPISPYLITITNRSAVSIVYNPAAIINKTIYSPELYERFKAEWKKQMQVSIAKDAFLGSLFTLFLLNQPRNIYVRKNARTVAALAGGDLQGDDQEISYWSSTNVVDLFFAWIGFKYGKKYLSSALESYKALTNIGIIEKPTTIKPLWTIKFFIWFKNKSTDPVATVYSAVTLQE